MKPIISILAILLFISCGNSQEIKTISTADLKELLAKEKVQLLDVRSPEEVSDGYIETAIFANYFDDAFVEKATQQLDKSKPVYLYCRSGNRSGKSAVILKEKGFEVYNVLGGYKQLKIEN